MTRYRIPSFSATVTTAIYRQQEGGTDCLKNKFKANIIHDIYPALQPIILQLFLDRAAMSNSDVYNSSASGYLYPPPPQDKFEKPRGPPPTHPYQPINQHNSQYNPQNYPPPPSQQKSYVPQSYQQQPYPPYHASYQSDGSRNVSSPVPHSGNQLQRYDEVTPPYTGYVPPNPQQYAPSQSNVGFDDDDRRSYSDGSDSRGSEHRRRRDRRKSPPRSQKERLKRRLTQDEKGIGAGLLGGAGGAMLGHELGGGGIATIGGLIAGAIGANMLESRHEKQRKDKQSQRHRDHDGGSRQSDDYYNDGHDRAPSSAAALGGLYAQSDGRSSRRHHHHHSGRSSRSRSRRRRNESEDSDY